MRSPALAPGARHVSGRRSRRTECPSWRRGAPAMPCARPRTASTASPPSRRRIDGAALRRDIAAHAAAATRRSQRAVAIRPTEDRQDHRGQTDGGREPPEPPCSKDGVSVARTTSGTEAVAVVIDGVLPPASRPVSVCAVAAAGGAETDAAEVSLPALAATVDNHGRRVTGDVPSLAADRSTSRSTAGIVSAPARRGAMVCVNTFSPAVGVGPGVKVEVTP